MVCLGFEPGVAGWEARTNPLSYLGTPQADKCLGLNSKEKQIRGGEKLQLYCYEDQLLKIY